MPDTPDGKKQPDPSDPQPLIDGEVCKGCGRCVAACPKHVLRLRGRMNRSGVQPAEYTGSGCTGCAICFYNCPEPHAIQVRRPAKPTGGRKA